MPEEEKALPEVNEIQERPTTLGYELRVAEKKLAFKEGSRLVRSFEAAKELGERELKAKKIEEPTNPEINHRG